MNKDGQLPVKAHKTDAGFEEILVIVKNTNIEFKRRR